MRSAYSAVFLCTLACASVPAASSSVVAGSNTQTARATAGAASSSTPFRGRLLAGNNTLEYFSGETLHDVLRRRAPLYLRSRGTVDFSGTADPIAVYLNGHFMGSLDVLASIPASEVFSVQRVTPTEAMMRFGPKHTNGALVVTLVRR